MKERGSAATQVTAIRALPKMMIAFVIRRCTVEIGHRPTAAEFAAWANNYSTGSESRRLFGRAITDDEARIILKHQARLVSAKSALPEEEYVAVEDFDPLSLPTNVVALAAVRARHRTR